MIILNENDIAYDENVFTDMVYILATIAKRSEKTPAEFISIYKDFLDAILEDGSFEETINAVINYSIDLKTTKGD